MNEQENATNYFKAKRDQYLIEIRKTKNNKRIFEKRVKLTTPVISPDEQMNVKNPLDSCETEIDIQNKLNELAFFLMEAMKARDYVLTTEAAEKIRRAVSEENPPIEQLIRTDIVPYIVGFLDGTYAEYEKLVEECLWIIANVATGDENEITYLLELGIVPKAMALLYHKNPDIKENAIWILGNISGESPDYRDQLLETDLVSQLEFILNDKSSVVSDSLMTQIAWLISLLFRGPRLPDFAKLMALVPFLKTFLYDHDKEIKTIQFTLSSFCSLSNGDNMQIQWVLDMKCVDKLVKFIEKNDPMIINCVLRIIGQLFYGDNDQVKELLNEEILDAVINNLHHTKKAIRREAAWALGNITASGENNIDQVFQYQNGRILDRLFFLIEDDDFTVTKECTFCLVNSCNAGNFYHIQELVQRDIIPMLISTLKQNGEATLLKQCISALGSILGEYKKMDEAFGTEYEVILRKIDECEGINVLQDLQKHADETVYEEVSDLIDQFFEVEDTPQNNSKSLFTPIGKFY